MPLRRTLSVYNALNSKEKKELNSVMLGNKKTSLQNLHNIVKSAKKAEKIKDKADLFKQIMGAEYSKKQDYLLRNEIRLYNLELKKILSNTHFQHNEDLQQKAFINELEKRELDDLLRFELNKKITEEEKNLNFYKLMYLYEKQFNLDKKNLRISSDIFIELKEKNLIELDNKLKFIGESVSETAYNLSYIERVLAQLNQLENYTEVLENKTLFTNVFKENLAFLNNLKTKAHQTSGKKKISFLEEVLSFLKTTNYIKIDKLKETIHAKHSLALEYMLLGNYNTAIDYYELCFEHKEVMSKNFYFGLSSNYITTLIKARSFEKASQFILENNLHESELLLKRMLPIVIASFILSNKIEEAEKLMPLKFDKQDLDYYHYLRILHCIILYENKLFELANNEAENFKKHLLSFSEKSNEMDNIISDFIISFIKIEFQYIGEQKIIKRNKLKEDLLRFEKQNKNFDSDSLIIIWINRQLLIQ